jgi:glucosyl-3-phosphoglycerate synthase
VRYIEHIVVVLGVAPNREDYQETVEKIRPLGDKARVLWTNGERINRLYAELNEAGLHLGSPGKGKSVWTAFGYLLSNPRLEVFALHDCDIVYYDRGIPARLCLPLVHSGLDFEFCKAYYARFTTQLHGRVVRLLVSPLLSALIKIVGDNGFLGYLRNFRYPLSGEFAVTANLAKSNRIPSDWGLEVGTLAEVFRNTSLKRVCQVDLCARYEHKHQALSAEDPTKGLMKMATDIMTTIFRTLASMGIVLHAGHFVALRSAYLRAAQDAIRQYHADALINGLTLDRHAEEQAVEGFARQILVAGEIFTENPLGGEAIPNWNRVLAAFPDFPQRLWDAATEDAREFSP